MAMGITKKMYVEALMNALNSKKDYKTCLGEAIIGTSNAPKGAGGPVSMTLGDDGFLIPDEMHVEVMFASMSAIDKVKKKVADQAVKDYKEGGSKDEKKNATDKLNDTKKLVRKLKPNTMTHKKMVETIQDLKTTLDIKEKKKS